MRAGVWKRWVWWLAVAAAVAGGAWGVGALGAGGILPDRQLQAARQAFSGPATTVAPAAGPVIEPLQYDLSEYRAYDGMAFFATDGVDLLGEQAPSAEPLWVDGAARQVLQSAMRRHSAAGPGAGTPAELYLLSPTVHCERAPAAVLHLTYPPAGAAFPPNLCAPQVEWADQVNDVWQVTMAAADGSRSWSAVTRERTWRLPAGAWREVTRAPAGAIWHLQVKGLHSGALAGGAPVVHATPVLPFRISAWPADPVIVYRLVVPPFNTRKTPDTFYRRLDDRQQRPFLLARNRYCFNCHSFSSKTGTQGRLSVQARYMAPGAALPVYLGVYDLAARQGWKARLPFDVQMSTYMSWSADGRYLALSANQQLVTFHPTVYETQYAGEPTSDVAVYDAESNTACVLPGADHPERLELLPCFTPDGQQVVFAAAPVGEHPARTQYGLYTVPFAGGRGGEPRPVPGASDNGRSNYYPRFSPDGRWLSFCQADAGILIKSSSDIYLMPADLSGPPRRLACNVAAAADSWHSWSSNSRWLVFASKRDDGIFARLYLAEIDPEGHAAPAVRVPLEQVPMASFNIPEFLAAPPAVSESDLYSVVRVEASPREVAAAGALVQDRARTEVAP